MKDHPEYYTENAEKVRVRQFFPSDKELDKGWNKWFAELEPAKGDEPLSYCYCSSGGPHHVPHFSGHFQEVIKLEKEIVKRKLWPQYEKQLAAQVGALKSDHRTINEKLRSKIHLASCEARCIAALAVVGSKHVRFEHSHEQPEQA